MVRNVLKDQSGMTLMEVLAGLGVLLLVLTAALNLNIAAYRQKVVQNQVSDWLATSRPGVDWIVRDIRRACDATIVNSSTLRLTMPGTDCKTGTTTITYSLAGTDVQRTGNTKPVASNVTKLEFYSDPTNTLVIHVLLQVDNSAWGNYRFDGHAAPRAKLKPAA